VTRTDSGVADEEPSPTLVCEWERCRPERIDEGAFAAGDDSAETDAPVVGEIVGRNGLRVPGDSGKPGDGDGVDTGGGSAPIFGDPAPAGGRAPIFGEGDMVATGMGPDRDMDMDMDRGRDIGVGEGGGSALSFGEGQAELSFGEGDATSLGDGCGEGDGSGELSVVPPLAPVLALALPEADPPLMPAPNSGGTVSCSDGSRPRKPFTTGDADGLLIGEGLGDGDREEATIAAAAATAVAGSGSEGGSPGCLLRINATEPTLST